MSSDHPAASPRERYLFLGSGLVLAIALLGAMAREQGWGTPSVEFQLRSPSADGLRAGQEVRISGLPVGTVKALQLRPDALVDVQLRVQKRYASLIGPRSVASLGQEGLVGDHFVVISADPRSGMKAGVRDGRRLPYIQPLAIGNLMHRLVETQMELQRTLRKHHPPDCRGGAADPAGDAAGPQWGAASHHHPGSRNRRHGPPVA